MATTQTVHHRGQGAALYSLLGLASLGLGVATPAFGEVASAPPAQNVIVMVADGQGFNTLKATEYYTGAAAPFAQFDVKLGMQTSSALNPLGYDPAGMAANFNYALRGATDSAAAATAMFSGQKVADGRINWGSDNAPLTTFFEQAAAGGKSIGAVSSVQISHATPAAVYGHNPNRSNYAQIAQEAIYGDYHDNLKVVFGAGHPDYDVNGQWNPAVTDRYVGYAPAYADLVGGSNGWSYIEARAAFESLADGPTPDKVFGVAQVNTTLQYDRSNAALNTNVPSLETMTRAALNVLDNNETGFAVMIEGGAVDWANHGNNLNRMLEEQIDFNASVQAVIDWVNSNSSWDETLLIVTADHECGHLWGPDGFLFTDTNGNGVYDADADVFLGYDQIVDRGVGQVPGAKYFSNAHSNALVPLFAQGAGAAFFEDYIIGADPSLAARYNLDSSWSGAYVDNTSIYAVMAAAARVPEPSGLTLILLLLVHPARRDART